MAHRPHPNDGKGDRLAKLFPESLIQESTIKRGGAFRCPFKYPNDDKPKNRYFFIINLDPDADDKLLVVTATSQIEARKAARPAKVLVPLDQKQYAELEKDSIIDCESLERWPKEKYNDFLAAKKIQPLDSLDSDTMKKICQAVISCRTINEKEKTMIVGPRPTMANAQKKEGENAQPQDDRCNQDPQASDPK